MYIDLWGRFNSRYILERSNGQIEGVGIWLPHMIISEVMDLPSEVIIWPE